MNQLTNSFFYWKGFEFLHLSEVNAGFFYKSAEDRERLVKAERQHTDKKVQQIIDLKKEVCNGNDKGFVVINQKVWSKFDIGYISFPVIEFSIVGRIFVFEFLQKSRSFFAARLKLSGQRIRLLAGLKNYNYSKSYVYFYLWITN